MKYPGDRVHLKNLSLQQLEAFVASLGGKPFRARQLAQWLYARGARSFKEMTNLAGAFRNMLEEKAWISFLEPAEVQTSRDGTRKYRFLLHDGEGIESVLLPEKDHYTLCLSTQVGCKFACAFCASGAGGFERNLLSSEILGQVLFLRDRLDVRLTNFVFMGMGEPLDNYDNVVRAVRILNSPQGLSIAARRMKVSTVGIIPAMEKLQGLRLQINLSLSLHATTEELRSRLLPVNRRYPLREVIKAGVRYVKATGRMITVEYILIAGVNDSVADARRLASVARTLRAKVNLIPCSPGCGPGYEPPPESKRADFLRALEAAGIGTTLRRSKGADIRAACGQLAGKARQS